MIVGLDLDGVLRNLHASLCKRWYAKTGINKIPTDILGWDTHKYLEIERAGMTAEEFYQWWFNNDDIYRLALPIRGSKNGVAQLAKKFELILVSDQTTATAMLRSIEFVDHCYPKMFKTIHFGSDKSLIYLGAMIDDGLHNLALNVARHRVLFAQPWNQQGVPSDIHRARGWQGVLDYFFGKEMGVRE